MLFRDDLRQVFFLGWVVPALVVAEFDVALIEELLDVRGCFFFVPIFGGADEVVVGEVHELERGFEAVGVDGRPLVGGFVVLRGGLRDLLRVLVGACEEEDIAADKALGASGDIGDQRGVAVSDMRTIVHIINRCGDVVRRLVGLV